jgi:hypothetical protein
MARPAKRTQGTNGSRPADIQTGSSHCGLPFRTRGHAYLFRPHRFRCDRHHTTRLLPRVVSYFTTGLLRVRNVQCQFPFTVLFGGRIRQSETWRPTRLIPQGPKDRPGDSLPMYATAAKSPKPDDPSLTYTHDLVDGPFAVVESGAGVLTTLACPPDV